MNTATEDHRKLLKSIQIMSDATHSIASMIDTFQATAKEVGGAKGREIELLADCLTGPALSLYVQMGEIADVIATQRSEVEA
jgi:hypothetical protein